MSNQWHYGQRVIARGDTDPTWVRGIIDRLDSESMRVTRNESARWYSLNRKGTWGINWVRPDVLEDSLIERKA